MRIIENTDDFRAEIEARFGPARPFEPTATYIPAGDCIEFIARPGRYRAQRLDDLVTFTSAKKTMRLSGRSSKASANSAANWKNGIPAFESL
jgi:hypothetical protein